MYNEAFSSFRLRAHRLPRSHPHRRFRLSLLRCPILAACPTWRPSPERTKKTLIVATAESPSADLSSCSTGGHLSLAVCASRAALLCRFPVRLLGLGSSALCISLHTCSRASLQNGRSGFVPVPCPARLRRLAGKSLPWKVVPPPVLPLSRL